MGGVERFLIRKDQNGPKNPFDDNKQTSIPALTDWQRRANDLRVRVPTTRLEAKPEVNVSSLKGLAEALAARHPLRPDSDSGYQKSKFDDTDFEESTISSIDVLPQEQMYVMSTVPHRSSSELLRPIDPPHHPLQHGEEEEEHEGQVNPKIEGDDDDLANDLNFHDPSNVIDIPALSEEIEVARRHAPANTRYLQAQISSHPNYVQQPDRYAVRSPSPMAFRGQPASRPRSAQNPIMAPPPTKPVKKAVTVVVPPVNTSTHTTTFDKKSSYTDSSADRTPPPGPDNPREQNRKKRPFTSNESLLDYDPATLKTMSFEDLESQPFDLDPRHLNPTENTTSTPHPPSILNSTSAPTQFLQTLKSLSLPSSSPEQLAQFLTSQSQDQWLACTSALENRLGELFVELKSAREERRQVARRFESEVRERMLEVRNGGKGIERALGAIRGRAGGLLGSSREG